jgi:hypothetical protein
MSVSQVPETRSTSHSSVGSLVASTAVPRAKGQLGAQSLF